MDSTAGSLPRQLLSLCSGNLLVTVTLCFMAGAALALFADHWLARLPLFPWGFAALLLLLCLTGLGARRLRSPLIALPLFVALGLLHTHLALQPPASPRHLANQIQGKSELTLVGRVRTMPECNGDTSRLLLDTQAMLVRRPGTGGEFQPVHGKVQLTMRGSADFVRPGETLMVMAAVDQVRTHQTPGAFDYRLHLAASRVHCSGWIPSPKAIAVVHEPQPSPWRRLEKMATGPERHRQRSAQFLEQHFSQEIAGMYQALLIGRIARLPPELLDAFKAVGCFHILSISGLHFGLLGLFVAGIWTLALKRSQWLLLHSHIPTLALVLTAPVLVVYTAIAGMNLPALRSLFTALLVLLAVLARRRRSFVNLIAAAALIILICNPLALFMPSFQLSFASVLAINLIVPRLPVCNMEQKRTGPRRWLQTVTRTILSLFYVSLAATAGVLPIQLFHFNQVSLTGPVMNLLIEPLLCLWALPCGLLAIPCLGWAPSVASWLFELGAPGIELAIFLARSVSRIPGGMLWTITPNILEILLYFLALILVLAPGRTRLRLTLAGCAALVLLVSFLPVGPALLAPRDMRVHFLDVGQGSATLVQAPDKEAILIDCGGDQSERFDPGQRLVAPFLWRQRIWRLESVLVSHPHGDHYNGLRFVMARFRPRRLLVNGHPGEEPAYQALLSEARLAGIPVQVIGAGDLLWKKPDLCLQCLGMEGIGPASGNVSINDTSLVLYLRYKQRTFLFPGDIEQPAEQRLLRSPQILRADVLLAPHHGSRTSGGAPFMAAVDPALIVVSASQRQRPPLPWPGRLEEWRQQHRTVMITGADGAVTCRTDGKRLTASSVGGQKYVFRTGTASCTRMRR